jgi:predicted nucleic acid-binding protein
VNVLVDTDILVDVALDRAPFADPAGHLLDLLERRRASGFLAWHSAANFYYLVAPGTGKAGARAFLLDLARFMEVAPTKTASLLQAGRLELRDFEDAMQVAAGLACSADVIATRNVRDYRGAPIEAVRPEELVARIT